MHFRIDPKYTDAMMSLANVLSMNGNVRDDNQALQLMWQASQLKPTDGNVLNNYATLLNKLGSYFTFLFWLPNRYIMLRSILYNSC